MRVFFVPFICPISETQKQNGMSDFDRMLWRQLQSGDRFDHLLPRSTCQSSYIGEGYTDYSIDQMQNIVNQYAHQTEKLSKVLQKSNLNATSEAIHDFLYNHFQYKADDTDQLLRSPACSWYTRKEGIDCKSYSIFASCLLMNMGITHYIRKIKQPGYAPNDYTHVYVIVPIDQPNGNLEKGYYVIDGTLKETTEPAFIGKSDLKMKLPHYALNAPAQRTNELQVRDGYSYQDLPLNGINLNELFKFKVTNIKSIFGLFSCIGGSSLTEGGIKTYLANIDKYFQELITKMNLAISQDNYAEVSNCLNEFYGNSKLFPIASDLNKKKGWNSCTSKRIEIATKAFIFYRDTAGGLLKAYVNEFFDQQAVTGANSSKVYSSEGAETRYGFRHLNLNTPAIVSEPRFNYTPDLTQSIPAFNLTAYVQQQADSGQQVNVATFLDSLTTIVKTFTPEPDNPNNPNDNYYETDDSGNVIDPKNPKPQQAGFTGVVGWVVGLSVLGYAFTQMKSQPLKSK